MPNRVGLIGYNSVEFVSLLLDIWNNGDCAVIIDPQAPVKSVARSLKEANVSDCYIQKGLNNNIANAELSIREYETSEILATTIPPTLYQLFHPDYSKKEAVILYSSGTTGTSRGIILSHYAINVNADAIINYMRPKEQDSIYIIKSLSHSSTLTGELLVALKTKMNTVISAGAVPPRYILNTIQKHKISILCLNPLLLNMLCDEYVRQNYDIISLKAMYISGDILTDTIYYKAHKVFSGQEIYNVYGLSEAAPRVSAQTKEACKTNSVGKPIGGVKIEIVDDYGLPVTTGNRGIIHISTPSLFNGYVSGDVKHKPLYKDWLNTGDIGFWDEYGELHVIGRADDMIVIGAHKIYPSDVEKKICDTGLVSECIVSKCLYNGHETLSCLYVGAEGCSLTIISHLKQELLPHEIPKRFVRTDSIPHTIRGKVNRIAAERILSSI